MFKREKEKPRQAISHEIAQTIFREIKIDPCKSASEQTQNLATFLLRGVDKFKHKVIIETDIKVIEITVSVESLKPTQDG